MYLPIYTFRIALAIHIALMIVWFVMFDPSNKQYNILLGACNSIVLTKYPELREGLSMLCTHASNLTIYEMSL